MTWKKVLSLYYKTNSYREAEQQLAAVGLVLVGQLVEGYIGPLHVMSRQGALAKSYGFSHLTTSSILG